MSALSRPGLLHRDFRLQVLDIAEDRRHREHTAVALETDEAVLACDIALDVERVPFFRVANIVDRHVVMLAPKERHVGEFLPIAEHIARRRLSLPLGDDPMLDTDVVAAVWVGPARNIAGS